jgi:hypothetical protein
MALSPNYGWAEPDNSSLVKNGAQDIRALGDAIDTSVWNIGYGQAGKNKIINGDFAINQRNFTSATTTLTFGYDRWTINTSGGVCTYSAQTFTAGTAPVAGYEAKNFARLESTGQSAVGNFCAIRQTIEDVRTFAGQTVTMSFWAKASTGTPLVGVQLNQIFGSGGSSDVYGTPTLVTLNTSWTRYTATVNVPSIAGKTIGTNSNLHFWLMTSVGSTISALGYPAVGLQNVIIDFWGAQVEYGSKATPFQTATGTLQGELSACQRYYYRTTADSAYTIFGNGTAVSTTQSNATIPLPVPLRISPSSIESLSLALFDGVGIVSVTSTILQYTGKNLASINLSVASGLTQYRPYFPISNNTTSAYIGFNAEL